MIGALIFVDISVQKSCQDAKGFQAQLYLGPWNSTLPEQIEGCTKIICQSYHKGNDERH